MSDVEWVDDKTDHSGDWVDDPHPSEQSKPETQADAALQGFGNGLTLGYAPQLQAMAEKPIAKLYDLVNGTNVSDDISDDYTKRRDDWIKRQEQLAQDNPKTFIAANLAGTGVGMAAMSPISALRAGGTVAKGASTAAKVGASLGRATRAAAQGATLAALSNPGDVEGQVDPLRLDARLSNSKLGALFGAGGAIAGDAIATTADKARAYLRSKAAQKAFKSAGPTLKDYRTAAARGDVEKLGGFMLDNNLLGAGDTFDDIASKAGALNDQAGGELDDIYKLAVANHEGSGLGYNPAVDKQKLMALAEERLGDHVDKAAALNKLSSYLDEVGQKYGEGFNPKAMQNVKSAMDEKINYSRNPLMKDPASEKAFSAGRGYMNDKIDETIRALSGSEAGDALSAANSKYGMSKTIEQIAKDRSSREAANRFLSPSDYGMSAVGALGGAMTGDSPEQKLRNAAMGAALGFANKGMRQYGNPIVAQSLNSLSSKLAAIPRFAEMARQNPQAYRALVQSLAMSPKFTPALSKEQPGPVEIRMGGPGELDKDSSRPSQYFIPDDQAKKQFLNGK